METTPVRENKAPNSLRVGAALGALSSLAIIGLFYLGDQLFKFPFVPFEIFDWMTRTLPGGLIAFVIRTMVAIIAFLQGFLPIGDTSTVAKLAEQTIAILQLVGGGAIFGLALAWLNKKSNRNIILYGQIGGLLLLALTVLIVSSLNDSLRTGNGGLWLGLIFLAWGWGLAWLVRESGAALADAPEAALSRRQFLTVSGAGLSAVALGSWGASRLFGSDSQAVSNAPSVPVFDENDPFGAALTSGPAASPSSEELAARPAPARGTRDEFTATDNYYRIDINTRIPEINGTMWRLNVSGLVDQPLDLSIDDIREYPSQAQFLTMQCISNTVGGDLTSSTRWKGVRFKDLMETAGIQANAAGALIKSVDGFFEFVVMDDIMDDRTLLVYDMNGEPLRAKHGFPLRVYIPNRYGMKQPKWIESIEMVDERVDGYWVVRGWSKEAIAHTVSVVDTVVVEPDQGENGTAIGGGIAWAGARGIGKVEVQVDDGDWHEAELIAPPLSSLSWILWRYEWPFESGRHNLRVRSFDGDGQLQESESRSARPNGATGYHEITVNL
jgi:DMSO/TMAO reductase YedYZ molybdopterin-dependent catalytic subunit